MRSSAEVKKLLEDELGATPFAVTRGINGSMLYFMNYGKRQLILQVWEGEGWEVYANSGSIKVDETLEWLKSLK